VDDHSLIACKCCKGARAHEIEGQVANAEDRNMFTAVFHRQVQFRSQADLTGRFESDRVTLAPGTELDLEGEVTLSPDIIFSGRCHLTGPIRVEIGSLLTNVKLGPRTIVRAYSILTGVIAGGGNLFGPFCFVRDDCVVGNDCILGAHVETTRSRFGNQVKISHRAFVGDAIIGDNVIIGAGVVFCNFDGQERQPTRVGLGVTIGSGSLLVPPITIGDGVLIGAGSIVTKNLAEGTKLIQKRMPTL